jgi:hypothetical protein
MFEEIISALEGMDVGFEEMPDQGMLSIQVDQLDKMQLIEVLNMVNSMGMTVTQLDETVMMISAGAAPAVEEPMLEATPEENTQEDADQMAALDEAMSGM